MSMDAVAGSDTRVLKVSLARPREHRPGAQAFDRRGARVILGAPDEGSRFAEPIVPAAHRLFGPRGASVTTDGALWVADTGHHRLLGWPSVPTQDNQAAQWLIGQPHFGAEGRNAKAHVHAASLNVPTGVCACGPGLAVADAWNHRVLIWHTAPRDSHVGADVVLGQADFAGGHINRGADHPSPSTLYWPYGVDWDGVNLWVADTGNRRVLRYAGLPQTNGQAAELVLGQPDFAHRDENAGNPGSGSLRWPHAVAQWQGWLCVADAGNNRLLLWAAAPEKNGAASDLILGQAQAQAQALDHNRGEYWPSERSFNMPYGLAVVQGSLFVADTANSRVLRFDSPLLDNAQALAGQHGFADKGDNRWLPAERDSLCWPYALAPIGAGGQSMVIVDSGNNRVLLWDLA